MPRVSVIIPTHNRPELLSRALGSIYNQTYQDFEVLVVDDGNQPRAEASLTNWLTKPHFKYLETAKDQGGAVTRNVGIKAATGEYIAFLDDDDEWQPEKLAKQVLALLSAPTAVGFSFTAVENRFDTRSEITSVPAGIVDLRILSLRRFKGFLTSTLLVKKEALQKVGGFDTALPSHQEADLVLRLAQRYDGLGLNEPLTIMDVTTNHEHIGSSLSRRIKGREMILKKHEDVFKKYPKLMAKHYFWLGLMYRDSGQIKKACHAFKKSFNLSFNIRTMIHYLKLSFFEYILRPAHFGTLLRELYFNFYFKRYFYGKHLNLVMDAGCGQGQYAKLVASKLPNTNVVGVDVLEAKAWVDNSFKNLTFKVEDLTVWDEVNIYDLIISIDNLEHIVNNVSIVEKFFNALKHGGSLYLAVPCEDTVFHFFPRRWFNRFTEWEKDEHVGEQWTLGQWQKILTGFGFNIKLARHTFTFWGSLAWELEFLLRGNKFGDRINLLLMPFYRLMALLDLIMPIGSGNNLIIATK